LSDELRISQSFFVRLQFFAGLEANCLARRNRDFFAGPRITSDAAIAVTGLRGHTNGRNEFLITSTAPAADLPDNAGSELFFPHFVNGGGYRVQFVLFGRSTSGTMYFLDSSGNPAPLQFQ